MKAILYRGGRAELADIPVPEIGPDELLLAMEACGLCGTDLMKLGAKPERAVLGHELCGRLAKVGRDVRGWREGERVVAAHHVPCGDCHYCRRGNVSMCRQFKATNVEPGGFCEYVKLSALHARHSTLRVPDGLGTEAASQTEPLACCLRNVKRLGARAGDAVGVVGLGAIGQLTARLLSHLGVRVLGLDLDAGRVKSLARYGRGYLEADAFEEAARAAGQGRGLDAVILSAGTPALAGRAVGWLRDGGSLNVFASFHPDPRLSLDLNQVYHRELSLISSYSPALEDLREALELIASGRVDPLFADQRRYELARFEEAVADVRARRATKAILLPREPASR
ncbi:MAG: alcohol dehydrogenase catalytic domain-containing protein [Elusimicrobia bacterium]|nr:alcohol dehydrogenase catalytic domain-containing protein [Elusimicrobiota bacterium]MDE2424685.1 alcohol dehydrogenase catalytic domain-containing protein [Elusimicrobiota bacterium]